MENQNNVTRRFGFYFFTLGSIGLVVSIIHGLIKDPPIVYVAELGPMACMLAFYIAILAKPELTLDPAHRSKLNLIFVALIPVVLGAGIILLGVPDVSVEKIAPLLAGHLLGVLLVCVVFRAILGGSDDGCLACIKPYKLNNPDQTYPMSMDKSVPGNNAV